MNASKLLKAIDEKSQPVFNNDTERCLWLAGTGSWTASHDIVESLPEPGASWIHAMLHREEGDLGNAAYWYSRADKSMPASHVTFLQELESIASELLAE